MPSRALPRPASPNHAPPSPSRGSARLAPPSPLRGSARLGQDRRGSAKLRRPRLGRAGAYSHAPGPNQHGLLLPVGLGCNWNGHPGGTGAGHGARAPAHGPGARARGPRSGHGARGPDPCEVVVACGIFFASIPSTMPGLQEITPSSVQNVDVVGARRRALAAGALAIHSCPRSEELAQVFGFHGTPLLGKAPLEGP